MFPQANPWTLIFLAYFGRYLPWLRKSYIWEVYSISAMSILFLSRLFLSFFPKMEYTTIRFEPTKRRQRLKKRSISKAPARSGFGSPNSNLRSDPPRNADRKRYAAARSMENDGDADVYPLVMTNIAMENDIQNYFREWPVIGDFPN